MTPDTSWSPEPTVLVSVALAAWIYVVRWRHARAQAGERAARDRAAPAWRMVSFMTGLLAIVAALVSPVDRLSSQLFVMHMVQHVLLLDLAPILLILGLTKVILRPATRRLATLERAVGPLAHPAFAVVLYVAVMWIWHIPAMYDAALRDPGLHVLEHTCFAWAGGLYWWHLLSPIRTRMRLGGMGPAIYMISTKVLVGILGIGLAFGPGLDYGFYAHEPHFWGLSPSDSQSAAGLIMALEQSLVMGAVLVALFWAALSESEVSERRAERLAG
jgi:putative membrane protein